MSENNCQYTPSLVRALFVHRREKLHGSPPAKLTGNCAKFLARFIARDLVGLGQQDVHRQLPIDHPLEQRSIAILQPASYIDDEKQAAQVVACGEILTHEPMPVRLHFGRHLRESIARKIDESLILLQLEKIDELREARRLAAAREIVACGNGVDGARFAGVRTSGYCDFAADIDRKLRCT